MDDMITGTKLVSLISPCYNGATYLPAFLESVVNQTYRPIELLFVDDGSKDETKQVFESYRSQLESSGIIVKYFYQANAGQAAAINLVLPHFHGEYLMWMDSDDILLPKNIEKKVTFLEENPEKGFVFCEGIIVRSVDLNKATGVLARNVKGALTRTDLFKDLIMERNVVYVPAAVMVRRQCFMSAIPTLHIYEGRQGQNFQLLLPLAYSADYGLISEPLFKYVVHGDSHSHSKRSYEEEIQRANEFENLICSTIEAIPKMTTDESQRWQHLVHVKCLRTKLSSARINVRKEDVQKYATELILSGDYSFNDSGVKWFLHGIKDSFLERKSKQ